jgi:long-chain alkane monooxygenase
LITCVSLGDSKRGGRPCRCQPTDFTSTSAGPRAACVGDLTGPSRLRTSSLPTSALPILARRHPYPHFTPRRTHVRRAIRTTTPAASILQEHPFNFARRISTLDHASKGRIAWNVVADDPPNAWAEEYVDVTYKLWEGSWEEDALRQDGRADSHAGDGKVHRINHRGPRYKVEGPHLVSPSPQRTPLLFQAGASEADRAFAARNAEAVFIRSPGLAAVAHDTADIRSRAASHGRLPQDIKFFQGLHVVTGDTEAEARRKAAELDERTGDAAQLSPYTAASGRIVGTPEQIADELARWQDAGVDGVNMVNAGGTVPYEEFVDHVAPVLQERGLMQREYAEGTLRHKLFGRGGRLPERHPAARYRGAFAPQHA